MSMDLKKTFGFNHESAIGGVWVDLGQDTHIKVAKLGTNKYQLALMKYTRAHQAKIRVGRLDPESAAEITANTLADTILLDWKGVVEDDTPVLYSRANAYRIMKDYPDFRALVEQHAQDPEVFQDQVDLDADSKNLRNTFNGISTMEETSSPSS